MLSTRHYCGDGDGDGGGGGVRTRPMLGDGVGLSLTVLRPTDGDAPAYPKFTVRAAISDVNVALARRRQQRRVELLEFLLLLRRAS